MKIRILGVDPGSRMTGYGCIEVAQRKLRYVSSGTINLTKISTGKLEDRLASLYQQLQELIETLRPDYVAIERIFFAKNAASTLKLGEARGVAVLSAANFKIKIAEYSATEIKRSVTGHGRSDKKQVAKMVSMVLGVKNFSSHDASDALAMAICHANHFMHGLTPIGSLSKKSKKGSLAGALSHKIKNAPRLTRHNPRSKTMK